MSFPDFFDTNDRNLQSNLMTYQVKVSLLTGEEFTMKRKPMPIAVRKGLQDYGDHLSEWRRLLNLTVLELAQKADVSESTIARLERGEGASLENVLRIGRALGIHEEMVSGADPWGYSRGRLLISSHIPKRAEKVKR